jgi:hypothetical protein
LGFTLFELMADGTLTSRGILAFDDAPVLIASNGVAGPQFLIASGRTGYLYDLNTDTLTSVLSDVDFVGYLDGFFVALDAVTNTLRISGLLDGTVWDPLQTAQSLAGIDWKAMIIANQEIWLHGSQFSEVWYNANNFPFPFVPNKSAGLLPFGIVGAGHSLTLFGRAPTWLASSADGVGMVVRANGYNPQRISDHAVEHAIKEYARESSIDDAEAWTYEEDGHTFYVLTCPTAEATWANDLSTSMWARRGFWNTMTGQFDAYRPSVHTYAFGKHLVGDRRSGTIYRMGNDLSTDVDGVVLRRMRRSPPFTSELQRVGVHTFQLDVESGLGVILGQGRDPTAMLRWSSDGGKTWSNERWTSIGKMGKFGQRVIWRRLGDARNRRWEVTFTEPVPLRIAACYLNPEVKAT